MKKTLAFIMTAFFAGMSCLVFPAAVSHAAVKRPMVAILPIKSQDKNYSYVGPAVTKMLDTRLSSEGIDTFVVSNPETHSEAVNLADFLVAGQVVRNENIFDAEIFLKEPNKGEVLKTWHLKAVSLGVLAQDTGLLSVKLAEAIKHAEDILINAPKEVEAAGQEQGGYTSEEYEALRMHPDRLVREKMAEDEKKEKEIEARKTEEQKRQEREQAKARALKKEPEEWFPIADVYDPESDELPKPEKQPADNSSTALEDQAEVSPPVPPGKSWYSKLWPFGGEKEKQEEQEDSWEKDRKKLQAEQKKNERVARVVPEDDLPYPPPKKTKFDIPEPVPLDQALAKIGKIYVEKPAPRKERGWLSWFWPWGEEKYASVEPRTVPEKPSVQAKIAPGEEMRKGVNSMIEGRSRKDQSTPGTMEVPQQRQEHVHFSPRIDTEENSAEERNEEAESPAGVENPPGQGVEMKNSLQARTEIQPRLQAAPAGTVVPEPEGVSTRGPSEISQSETDNELKPAVEPAGEQKDTTDTGETKNGKPENFDGPIWRWY